MKITILFLLLSFASFSQRSLVKDSVPELILTDPPLPEFKGGSMALLRYVRDSIVANIFVNKEEVGTIRTAYAKFTVTESGKITNVRIIRSSNIPRIDSLYKSALKKMPDWIPAFINGKGQAVDMNLPLKIELR
jgi:hypothetical protein